MSQSFILGGIYSSIVADLMFKVPGIFLHSKLAFSKARNTTSSHLASGSVTSIFMVLVNLCKLSIKVF